MKPGSSTKIFFFFFFLDSSTWLINSYMFKCFRSLSPASFLLVWVYYGLMIIRLFTWRFTYRIGLSTTHGIICYLYFTKTQKLSVYSTLSFVVQRRVLIDRKRGNTLVVITQGKITPFRLSMPHVSTVKKNYLFTKSLWFVLGSFLVPKSKRPEMSISFIKLYFVTRHIGTNYLSIDYWDKDVIIITIQT